MSTEEKPIPDAYLETISDTFDQLDQILNYMADDKLKTSGDISFNVSHLVDTDGQMETNQLIQKLINDKYIEPVGDEHYRITFDGKHFLNNTWLKWKRKPYAQKRGKARAHIIWTIAKTIIVIVNGFAIVWLMNRSNQLSFDTEKLESKLEVANKLSEERRLTIKEQSVTIGELENELEELKSNTDSTDK